LFVAQSAYFTLKFDDMLHERWYGPQTETQKKNPCRWVSIFSSTDLFIGGIVLSCAWIHGNLPATHKFEFAAISGLEERRFWWQCGDGNSPWEIGKRMFNVMLVERRQDVAHRLGVGRVYIEDWRAAGPVEEVVVLG